MATIQLSQSLSIHTFLTILPMRHIMNSSNGMYEEQLVITAINVRKISTIVHVEICLLCSNKIPHVWLPYSSFSLLHICSSPDGVHISQRNVLLVLPIAAPIHKVLQCAHPVSAMCIFLNSILTCKLADCELKLCNICNIEIVVVALNWFDSWKSICEELLLVNKELSRSSGPRRNVEPVSTLGNSNKILRFEKLGTGRLPKISVRYLTQRLEVRFAHFFWTSTRRSEIKRSQERSTRKQD